MASTEKLNEVSIILCKFASDDTISGSSTLNSNYYFPSKKIFERKIFNSGVGVFFIFLKLPMTHRVQVCRIVGVLYNICVACHRG